MITLFDRILSWAHTRRFYGSRCPDYDSECHCCKAWREHDDLTINREMIDA